MITLIERRGHLILLLGAVLSILSACNRPISKFVYDKKDGMAPAVIHFENLSQKADQYVWDFGDGTSSTEVNPEHRYVYSGNYLVRLKAIKGKKHTMEEKRVKIDAPLECLVRIETPYGEMVAKLYDETPLHRDNFSKLADEGYFDELLFHRVIKEFMIQGGDPNSRNAQKGARLGMGGPGYQIPAEFDPKHIHLTGALAAARTGGPMNPEKKSSGSQFYIVHGREVDENLLHQIEMRNGVSYTQDQIERYKELGGTPFLDGEYTVFGQVIEGLDVLNKIAQQATDGSDRPLEDIWMKISVIK